MRNTLFSICLVLLVILSPRSCWGGFVNYLQGADGNFAVNQGLIVFDSTSGQLSYGDSLTMTAITAVADFTGALTLPNDPFITVFNAYTISGTVGSAATSLVFAQQYDASTDDTDQEVLSTVAADIQAYLDQAARTPAEVTATTAANNIYQALTADLAFAGVIQDDDGTFKVHIAFDLQKLIDGNAFQDDTAFSALIQKLVPFIGQAAATAAFGSIGGGGGGGSTGGAASGSTGGAAAATTAGATATATATAGGGGGGVSATGGAAANPSSPAVSSTGSSNSVPTSLMSEYEYDKVGDDVPAVVSLQFPFDLLSNRRRKLRPARKRTLLPDALIEKDEEVESDDNDMGDEETDSTTDAHSRNLDTRHSRRRHRRHRSHHHYQHRDRTFDPVEFTERNQLLFGRTGAPVLAGGAMLGRLKDSDFGTMGGLVIAPGATGGQNNYRLLALTNEHVVDVNGVTTDPICQPIKNLTSGVCQPLGTAIAACCPDQTVGGHMMDAALVPIDPKDRWNTQCAQYRTVTQPVVARTIATAVNANVAAGAAATVQAIQGMAKGKVGDVVKKYGARSGLTTGKLSGLIPNAVGSDWAIKASTMPDFADDSPDSEPGKVPSGFSGTVPPQVSPATELKFFNRSRDGLIGDIKKMWNPKTSATYTQDEAAMIFDILWANGRVIGDFATGGDSGSWGVRDFDNKAVVLINRAGWQMQGPFDLNIPASGRSWGKWNDVATGYDMGKTIKYMNKLLRTNKAGFQIQVCQESSRPVPTAAQANCASATVNTDGTCTFPFACKPSGTTCIPQDPSAVQ